MPPRNDLCKEDACRRLAGHTGKCDQFPSEAWGFLEERDKKKLDKAGFATPRGGAKGAYQNHVTRSSKVIVPYERRGDLDLSLYQDGYVVRLFPDQYFAAKHKPKAEFTARNGAVSVGKNAFVLYRTHSAYADLPPMPGWKVRTLIKNGRVVSKRGVGAEDHGHYVLRLATLGEKGEVSDGPPQGIFATEYADANTNYLCKCVLAWLTLSTTRNQLDRSKAKHIAAILSAEGLDNFDEWERRGILRGHHTCCPLCLRTIEYRELHDTVSFEEAAALSNAGIQVEGATRSTVVNLFHIEPLVYHALTHVPRNIGWGHAVCNTMLGQRHCYSVYELQEQSIRVSIARDGDVQEIGWMAKKGDMIRSDNGAVWTRLSTDMTKKEREGAPGRPPIPTEEED